MSHQRYVNDASLSLTNWIKVPVFSESSTISSSRRKIVLTSEVEVVNTLSFPNSNIPHILTPMHRPFTYGHLVLPPNSVHFFPSVSTTASLMTSVLGCFRFIGLFRILRQIGLHQKTDAQ